MILICYDGSADARAAISAGGELLGDQPATVLTVWQPFVEVLTRSPGGIGLSAGISDVEALDKSTRENAERLAEEGAGLARDAGFNAQARSVAQESTIADAILSQAQEVGASAVLMGSRGLTGVKSFLLGSVSHAVIQHADVSVIVVPSPAVATARTRQRRGDHLRT